MSTLQGTIDVRHIASLIRLRLTEEEVETFQQQITEVLQYVAQLERVDISEIEQQEREGKIENNLRADEVRPSLDVETALSNAPQQSSDLVIVPKIIE